MSHHMTWDHPLFLKDEEPNRTKKSSSSSEQEPKSKVALASKNARERRKKEFESLMQENTKLREEREKFQQNIEMLQQKVIEMREQEGDLDLQLENDLLKAQLLEHSMFVSGLMKMASGVPTTDAEKKQLYRQGADYSVAHINSLLSRSVRLASEWRKAKMPSNVGFSMSVWYQHVTDPETGLTRLNMRADQIFPNFTAEQVSAVYWSLWASEAAVREMFENTYVDGLEIKTQTMLHDELRISTEGEEEEALATLYTRDDRSHHVFIASKREQYIARGSLALAVKGDDVGGELFQPWKRRKCRMCARSNTNVRRLQQQVIPTSSSSDTPSNEETDEAAVHTTSPLNNPTYIEGSVCWDLDDNRGARTATVISLVEGFTVGKFDGFGLVTRDGQVSEEFVNFTQKFIMMLKASVGDHSDSTTDSDDTSRSKSRKKVKGPPQ